MLQLTIYRIVQEAVSNVIRHAPGAATTVSVTRESTRAAVTIVNNRPDATPPPADSGGMGLIGMAERVALLDGTLEHGTTAEGGFRVVARLPLEIRPARGDE